MRPDPQDTVLFIRVVKYEYKHQPQWGFDGILTKAKIQSWVTKWNKDKRMIQDANQRKKVDE